ncbi:MAG: ribbon-helix-helix domain-containing protein [Candidatus Nanoarchaeia archaeon]|nr:ribbon-helix-helix domain-containing protein [Candidatus Nanoarchaeia archaeon]MDD5238969.1 ribbon-helix-helix domain-containing protein [Candidatus Nanoarchaeia archaeon]
MRTITVATKLTEKMAEVIDALVKEGVYTNRSEALRDAVRLQIRMYRGIISGEKLKTQSGKAEFGKADKDKMLKKFAMQTGLNI